MTYLAAGAGALGPGLLLLSRSRAALLAGFALLAVAEGALLADVQVGEVLGDLVGSRSGLAALAAGLVVLGALATLLVRYPIAVAPLALVAAPLRPPLELGAGPGFPLELATSGELGRLIPLYVVLAAATLALAWRVLRGEPVRTLPPALAVPATALLGLVAVSILWARNPSAAADELVFFWLPFAALLAVVARSPADRRLARLLAAALVVPALIFAAVGLYQAAAGRVFFFSSDLAAGNAYGSLFRVTSLFDDPSHYGRHLVLAIVVVLAALWLERARLWPSVAVLLVLGAGLWFSYSQSSMVALVATALALALVAGDRRARWVAATTAVAVAVAGAAVLGAEAGGDGGRSVTSERSRLVEDTAVVFANHPVAGVGVAGQPLASREEAGARGDLRRSASHTTPLTVAAELGAIGLLAYVALLLGAVRVIALARARDPALGLGLAAVLLSLFVHSLSYEGFFDNPITWGVLGLAAAVASGAPVGHRAPAAARSARPSTAIGDVSHPQPTPQGVPSGG